MLLELSNVEKNYESGDAGAQVSVLKNVSLRVEQGEKLAIMGPSGSGKSTLLNIIGALDRASSGTVKFRDTDMSSLSDAGLAEFRNRNVGFVFQLHHLLPQCSVLENVLVPVLPQGGKADTGAALDRARRLLERVGLKDRINYRPGRLSGGERQRAAVVRALINKPALLLADEPTGSLDQVSAEHLADLLVELNREEGIALVVVTHSVDLAKRMSTIYRLQRGELAKGSV